MSSRVSKSFYNYQMRRNRIQKLWEEKDIMPKQLPDSQIRVIRAGYKNRVDIMVYPDGEYANIATKFITALSREDYVLFNEYLWMIYRDDILTNFEMLNEAKEFFGSTTKKYSEYLDWITEEEKKKNGIEY